MHRAVETLDQVVSQLIDELQNHWLNNGKKRLGPSDEDPFRASLSHIVLDALQAHNPSCEQSMASIHKSSGHYSKRRYWSAAYGYKIHIKRSYDGLCELGYIHECKKGVYTDHMRLLTRYRATPKLIDLFEDGFKEELHVIGAPSTNNEIIRLKITQSDGHKELVEYEDTQATNEMRADLAIINGCLSRSWADLELDEDGFRDLRARMLPKTGERFASKDGDGILRLQNRTLHRVFNDLDFSTNGRLYGGWWQSIPKEYRPFILINGKRTIELDYSGLHPNLIYALSGHKLEGDPYEIPQAHMDWSRKRYFRKAIKRAFNAMLNADHELMREPTGVGVKDLNMSWSQVKAAIIERHKPIAHQFFTSIGSKLQLIDSQIAIAVLKHFAQMQIPVLPVHDSFIMHSGYEEELKEVMRAALKQETGLSVPLRLTERESTPKPPSIDDDDEFEMLFNPPPHELRLDAFRELMGSPVQ